MPVTGIAKRISASQRRAPAGDDAVPVLFLFDASGGLASVRRIGVTPETLAEIERTIP